VGGVSAVAVSLDAERLRLDAAIRATLIRLTLLSQVAAHSYGGGTGGGHPSSSAPAGESRPSHERLHADYERALSNADRQRVLDRAKAELESWRKCAVKVDGSIKADVTFDEIVLEDGEGFDAELVAQRFGIAVAHVCRIRHRAGRNASDGTDPEASGLPREKRRAEAVRMRGKGMSQRQIALALGCSPFTINRDLREAK
jgi:transposase